MASLTRAHREMDDGHSHQIGKIFDSNARPSTFGDQTDSTLADSLGPSSFLLLCIVNILHDFCFIIRITYIFYSIPIPYLSGLGSGDMLHVL